MQYVVSGMEQIKVTDLSRVTVKKEYDASCDAAFFGDCINCGRLVLENGDFAVFYPHDAHMPGLAINDEPCGVKKIVVKIKV